jgi:hypothetical protein
MQFLKICKRICIWINHSNFKLPSRHRLSSLLCKSSIRRSISGSYRVRHDQARLRVSPWRKRGIAQLGNVISRDAPSPNFPATSRCVEINLWRGFDFWRDSLRLAEVLMTPVCSIWCEFWWGFRFVKLGIGKDFVEVGWSVVHVGGSVVWWWSWSMRSVRRRCTTWRGL